MDGWNDIYYVALTHTDLFICIILIIDTYERLDRRMNVYGQTGSWMTEYINNILWFNPQSVFLEKAIKLFIPEQFVCYQSKLCKMQPAKKKKKKKEAAWRNKTLQFFS